MKMLALFLIPLIFLAGCGMQRYSIPHDAANFGDLGLLPPASPEEIAAALDRRPAAPFPAMLATVRIQGGGGPWVINLRSVEHAGDMDRLAKLLQVRGVIPLSDIVCPNKVDMAGLRSAAAGVRADLLLVYTFETTSRSDTTIPVLGLLTLGIFPNEMACATSTGSAALVDTRTGYIYGLAEATSSPYRITNAWNIRSALENSEEDAQRLACKDLVAKVESMWEQVLTGD